MVTFHVLPEPSNELRESLQSFQIDPTIVREKLDEFFKGVIEERFAQFKMDERIQQQMERRIEVAVKSIMPRLEAEVNAMAIQQVRERAKQMLAAMPITVDVRVGSQEAP